jgi:hypothetical protein
MIGYADSIIAHSWSRLGLQLVPTASPVICFCPIQSIRDDMRAYPGDEPNEFFIELNFMWQSSVTNDFYTQNQFLLELEKGSIFDYFIRPADSP